MNLSEATSLGQAFVDAMRPFCHRVEMAGSIRRQKAEVKDIEIVAVPNWGTRVGWDLFGSRVPVNLLYEWAQSQTMVQWIKPGTSEIEPWPIKPEGKYWRGLFPSGIKLDLFLCTEINWGVIYAIRTGSAEFSEALVTHAKNFSNYRVNSGHLWTDDDIGDDRKIVPCPEEAELFRLLNLAWVDPEKRIGRAEVLEL